MTMVSNMCDRHFLLILTLVGMVDNTSHTNQRKRVEVRDLYRRFHNALDGGTQRTSEFWTIGRNSKDELCSAMIEDDLAQLHTRGYIYVDADADLQGYEYTFIDVTLKAKNLVRQFVNERIHAMIPAEARTPPS